MRMPDHQLQTQGESVESKEAKERIRERGQAEKVRRDKVAREEAVQVGMQVLLKNKRKKKGMPLYDPRSFTIVELVGRQAVIQRSNKCLHRETKKFKRFFPVTELQHPQPSDIDDWEESSSNHNVSTTQEHLHNDASDTPQEEPSSVEEGAAVTEDTTRNSTTQHTDDVPRHSNTTTSSYNDPIGASRNRREQRTPDWYGNRVPK